VHRSENRPPHRGRWAPALPSVVTVGALLATAVAAGARAAEAPTATPSRTEASRTADHELVLHSARKSRHRGRASAATPLVLGIYPGGAAGTVGPGGAVRPEIAELRLQALSALRGGARRFVVHLYDAYVRADDADAVPAWLAAQIAEYTANGFEVELVLTYRPERADGDVDGFVRFVRARVRQLGPNAGLTHLQVTNEANVRNAPDAADGAYRGARGALVRGVVAAKKEARHRGFDRLRVGFNWAYQLGPAEAAFFAALGARGGRAFARAVDWVGLDAYPGTWGPPLATGEPARAVRAAILGALGTLRRDLLPLAHLPRADLHVSESGYPTGPGRTEAMQETVLRAAVRAVADAREPYGVTGFRWFDLRDADSSGASFESHYGLMRDDYAPKRAFEAYRELIATLR
jgi:hypothetical protein